MRLKYKLRAVGSFIKVRFFRKRVPIVATWPIINRCNYQCIYCDRWQRKTPEISTDNALRIIDELSKMGCIKISFSGGEPLLRDDIGTLIDHCADKNISCTVISNGSLIEKRIKNLKRVELLKLSLDGPPDVNSLTRGEGAYEKVLIAYKLAKEAGIKVIFRTVLTRHNVRHIDAILDLSSRLKVRVMFGPVYFIHNHHPLDETIRSLFPPKEEFNQAVDKLIYAKKRGGYIVNSLLALQYMKRWPHPSTPCYGGRAFCHISPDSRLYHCHGLEHKNDSVVHINDNFEAAFNSMSLNTNCSGCWCTGTLEFNLALALKPAAVLALAKLT